ncbi:MAG: GGDEF domain-containing protein [Comamonadaceae bacterium]|nr:GGDEF domain-containing protein [Comamonadaceae bacterium]
MALDLFSLLLLGVLVTAMLALSLFVVAAQRRQDGLFDWALATTALCLTAATLAVPQRASPWLTVLLPNGLLTAAFAFTLQGLLRFHGQAVRWRWVWAPVPLALLLSVLLLAHPRLRAYSVTGVLLAQLLHFAWVMYRHWGATPGRGKYLFATGSTLLVLALGVRSLDLLHAGPELTAPLLCLFCMAAVVSSMGSVLMSKERADARNHQLAYADELTGLHNRRAMGRYLVQQMAQARRARQPLSLMLLDIDHFKRVNDTHGHLTGDQVLTHVAQLLQASLRTQDVAGRWGGEEFVLLLPNTAAAGALVLAERLRSTIALTPFLAPGQAPLPVTVSIGLHTLQDGLDESAADLLDAADQALYDAKDKGRNCGEVRFTEYGHTGLARPLGMSQGVV